MQVTFWGTRGSIGIASPQTMRYGGNTSCVEIRTNAGTLLVLDCGTGSYPLGQAIVANPAAYPSNGHLLISHTHWDHIQGIPFFAPLFAKTHQWTLYAPQGLYQSLRDTLAGQMNYTYSPISLNDMGANIDYQELVEGVFEIDDVRIRTQFLNHPALTLGYQIEADGAVVVYACDHESHCQKGIPDADDLKTREARHINFLRGADLVIHDAQYTAVEYEEKRIGWGHSTVEYAIAVCTEANVSQLALTHHDPLRTDKQISELLNTDSVRLLRKGHDLKVLAAAENLTLKIKGNNDVKRLHSRGFPAEATARTALKQHSLFVGTLKPVAAKIISAAAKAEHIRIQTMADAAAAADPPSLILLDSHTPRKEINDIFDIVRTQKAQNAPEIPVVMITYSDDGELNEFEISSITTDWMPWPFSEQFARTKLRAWLLRYNCRWIRAGLPVNEKERLQELHSLNLLHTNPEERFDRITRLAAAALEVPIALISLVDRDTQWFKSCIGLNTDETSREVAFCAHAILEDNTLVITDTLLDDRFADNPLVTAPPHIRFYAGCPIKSANDFALGTLCLIDTKPRVLTSRQLKILQELAALVENEIRKDDSAAATS